MVIGPIERATKKVQEEFRTSLNAYIKTKKLPENNSLFVDIRGKKIKAKVVDIPFTNSKALK